MATVFGGPDELLGSVGQNLGTTEWLTVTPEAVSEFATATWLPAPAAADSVPPMMILSLTNLFLPQLLEVRGVSSGINYGTELVRFGPTVHPGDRLRASAVVTAATEVPGGVQTTVEITVESQPPTTQASAGPACVVKSLSRWLR
jgi:acyl dehydratase